jgi:hypothetical protein
MKHVTTLILGAALLLGCDGGKAPLAQAGAAEVAGNFTEAGALYRGVCDKSAALCPIATQRAEHLRLKEASKALGEGEYKKAKAALETAQASSDAGVKRAAEAMSKLADLEKGLVWEEASASPNQDEALPAAESVAAAGVAASPKARAWLEKNRPRLLLDRVKAACKVGAKGSCVEAGKELADRCPGSPESVEAQSLVEANYARLYPLLVDAEGLLGRQAYLETKASDEVDDARRQCQLDDCGLIDIHCMQGATQGPPAQSLEAEWKKKVGGIDDPAFAKPLAARWPLAVGGSHEPESWPKPGGKK